jgi:dTDP-4-dehydrorhamnose reductase
VENDGAMKYLVVGGSGFLGQELLRVLGEEARGTFSTKPFEGGISFDSASSTLRSLRDDLGAMPQVVFLLHGIANPDFCAKNLELTRQLNVLGMQRLINEAWEGGALPVYMSTDYVFDGSRGSRTESDARCPTTEYGRQKAEIEEWLEDSGQPFIVCRSSKIVSGNRATHSVLGQWLNDLEARRPMRCAVDQIFSPAHVNDTALSMKDLVAAGARGVFNVAGPESVSRYDLAKMLLDAIRPYSPDSHAELIAINLAEIPFYETRPLNTSLDVSKLHSAIQRRFRSLESVCKEIAEHNFG